MNKLDTTNQTMRSITKNLSTIIHGLADEISRKDETNKELATALLWFMQMFYNNSIKHCESVAGMRKALNTKELINTSAINALEQINRDFFHKGDE